MVEDKDERKGCRGPADRPSSAEPEDGQRSDGDGEPVAFVDPSRLRVLLLHGLKVVLYAALDPLDVIVIERERGGVDVDPPERTERADVELRVDAVRSGR